MAFGYYPTAWDISIIEDLPPADRLVLLALVEHANELGECFPSQERLGKYTGYTERTVRRSLRRLQALGYIERDKSRQRKRRSLLRPHPASNRESGQRFR